MKISKLMLTIISVMLVAVMVLMPSQVRAATDEKLAVVNASSEENSGYIIYVDGLLASEFEFALSSNKEETDLVYVKSAKDDAENSVAYYDASQAFSKVTDVNQPVYLWVKDNAEIQGLEVNLTDSITTSELAEIENVTKTISVKPNENYLEDSEEVNGVKVTTIVDSVKINADENEKADYYYQLIKKTEDGKDAELWNLLSQIQTAEDTMPVNERVKLATDFSKIYNELLNNAEWTEVKDYTIEQPEDAEDGTQYLLLLKKEAKVDGDIKTTYDAQFLTSAQEPFENYENVITENTVVVKRTAKLPITYDSMILWAVLAVIVIALIVVRARMNRNKKESKH